MSDNDPTLAEKVREQAVSWFKGKQFTQDWMTNKIPRWAKLLGHFRDREIEVLEVGSYEGRSAIFLLGLLPLARVTCLDLFINPPEYLGASGAMESRFDSNLEEYRERIVKIKGSAITSLDMMRAENKRFDLIYLDAGKQRDHVLAMSLVAWPLLVEGGILIWDDYDWGTDKPAEDRPHDAIDVFLGMHGNELEILWRSGQVFVKKIARTIKPAANRPELGQAESLGHAMSGPGQFGPEYWQDRFDLIYYQAVDYIVRAIGRDAKSIIDVGSGSCPYLEWFHWIERKVSIDIVAPYGSDTIQPIMADILDYEFTEKFDLGTCLQVLEHVENPTLFARRLLELTDRLIVSIPYKWPEGRTEGHLHDPVDEQKLESWFGRAPNFKMLVGEPLRRAKHRRMIAIFDADPSRKFGQEDIKNRIPKSVS